MLFLASVSERAVMWNEVARYVLGVPYIYIYIYIYIFFDIFIQGVAFNVTHFESRIADLLYAAINTTEHGQVSQCLGNLMCG